MSKIDSKPGTGAVIVVIATLVLLSATAPAFGVTTISGSGATFPQLLYQQWAADYNKSTGVQVTYAGTASGAGQSAIEAGMVDFAGSDQPLSAAVLSQYDLVQFPSVIGGIVMAYNLPGIGSGKLRLTGSVLAQIYLGQITTWDDPAIKALNPKLKLPSNTITVVYRSDSSGTTWNFTTYLSRVSPAWRTKYGASKSPSWPVGTGVDKSAGVASVLKSTKYALGYLEFSYAVTNNIPYAQMQNRSNQWVLPSPSSFAAAAAGATWSWSRNQFATVLANAPGKGAWPMTAATFVLLAADQKSLATGKAVLQFFNWGYTNSQAKADDSYLQFVPLPKSVVGQVEAMWHSLIKSGGTACWP